MSSTLNNIAYALSSQRILTKRALSVVSSTNTAKQIEGHMRDLEQRFWDLNNQTRVNLSSPKQVADVIQCKSTTKASLKAILCADEYSSTQKKMADILLKWKNLKSQLISIQELAEETKINSQNGSESITYESVHVNRQRLFLEPGNSYIAFVDSLFASQKCQINEMWKDVLLNGIDKPSAKSLVFQLDSNVCPMGYSPVASTGTDNTSSALAANNSQQRKTPLVDFIRERKKRHPTSILVTRVGDFYEAIGIDAILLVQYAGLNPMGGKARAGCPIKNIQQTLDDLTESGFSIAVYEEAMDTDSSTGRGSNGGAKSQLKRRIFAQQVSPANPTYMYDLCLSTGNMDTLSSHIESRPHVGIVHTSAGYTVVEINWEERSVRVSERLPAEAVACRLAAYPPVQPLLYVPTPSELEASRGLNRNIVLPFLPSRSGVDGAGSHMRIQWLRPFLLSGESAQVSELERCKNVFLHELLRTVDESCNEHEHLSPEDFTLVGSRSSSDPFVFETMPLHKETAIQLGLVSNPHIPDLIANLLPQSAPAATRRFLKRWLLVPPPPRIADSMRGILKYVMGQENAQPPMYVPQVGKLVSLIRASQANSHVFQELMGTLSTTVIIIDEYSKAGVVSHLLALVEHESGMKAEELSLRSRCMDALQCIEKVVQPIGNDSPADRCSHFGSLVPPAFFERNEVDWRGRIRREIAESTYTKVEVAAQALVDTMKRDFWGLNIDDATDVGVVVNSKSSLVAHDIFDNMLALKSVPRWAESESEGKYYHPRDRNGKLMKNRWTTKEVEAALSLYIQACQDACDDVKSALTQLSETLCDCGHMPCIIQASHANLISSTCYHHAAYAKERRWTLAEYLMEPDKVLNFEKLNDGFKEPNEEEKETDFEHITSKTGNNANQISESHEKEERAYFSGLWPYWMNENHSVSNSFELSGLFVLTSPNMSGKSTLMRSTATAALLTACGLCAPLGRGSWIKHFDAIFVRGASADVPSEGKSAFGAEMGDIAALFRSCSGRSLVFVDELARGTSPRDGTSLAGAVLEEMALKQLSGFFATHLHGILRLPLKEAAAARLRTKRMAINESALGDEAQSYGWTYKLEDGVCTNSLALKTAERFGLSKHILNRAEAFSDIVTDVGIISSSAIDRDDLVALAANGQSRVASKESIDENLAKGLPVISNFLEGIIKTKVFQIPSLYLPPAQLAGSSCVYVLELKPPARSSSAFYVGQTAHLPTRISQHRKKGKHWKNFDAIAIPIEKGTDEARNIESLTIRELSRLGYELVSWADG